MGVNRRSFLRHLIAGAATVAVATQVPVSFVKAVGLGEAVREKMIERLHRLYREQAIQGLQVVRFAVGSDAWQAYEGELQANYRFVAADEPVSYLKFKGARVTRVGRGWDVHVAEVRSMGVNRYA
jgi:hypothetical protein